MTDFVIIHHDHDFSVADHGTAVKLTPNSQAAKDWADECIADLFERKGDAFSIDHTEVRSVLAEIEEAGLTVDD